MGLPKWHCGKESACQCRKCSRHQRHGFNPWVGKFPWSMKWQPTSVFLPGKFHGERSLMGYSPWGCKESDMTERRTPNLRELHWDLFPNFLPLRPQIFQLIITHLVSLRSMLFLMIRKLLPPTNILSKKF